MLGFCHIALFCNPRNLNTDSILYLSLTRYKEGCGHIILGTTIPWTGITEKHVHILTGVYYKTNDLVKKSNANLLPIAAIYKKCNCMFSMGAHHLGWPGLNQDLLSKITKMVHVHSNYHKILVQLGFCGSSDAL